MNNIPLISFDYAIKYLLKNKKDYDIIEGFISALFATEGYDPVKITALLDSESNKEVIGMKRSIADLIVEDKQGHKFIVEIDRSYTNLFLHKACFNSCRLIIDNIDSNQDYSTIKKVFHINLLYFPFAKMKSPLYHGKTIFHEIDQKHPQDFHIKDKGTKMFDAYNVLPEYFIISVPLFDDIIKNEIDEWLYVAKYSKVRGDFKSPYMKKVAQRLSILQMTQNELVVYDKYMNKSLKERDYIVSAEEMGMEKGMKKGKIEERVNIAKNLLKAGLSINIITESTGLTKNEIEKLKS